MLWAERLSQPIRRPSWTMNNAVTASSTTPPSRRRNTNGSIAESENSATAAATLTSVELRKQTADIVSLGDAANRWEDADKLANLYAQVFASPAEAHELMAPFNAYSRGWGERFGRITEDEEIDGLGDEAWLLRTEANGTEVTYHWRRENLVVEAHLHCFGFCPGNVDAAARAWVDAIDEAARAGS